MSVVRSLYLYDNERLVVDVANSVYAIRNHIQPAGIRHLWNSLSNFISVSIKSHKVNRELAGGLLSWGTCP